MWKLLVAIPLIFWAGDAIEVRSASVSSAEYIPLRRLINPGNSATAWHRQLDNGGHTRPAPVAQSKPQPAAVPPAEDTPQPEIKANASVASPSVTAAASAKQPEARVGRFLKKHLSDKASNGYGDFYDMLLRDRKNDNLKILEIGLGTLKPGAPSSMTYLPAGTPYKRDASLYALREYFPKAQVFGIDVQKDVMLDNEQRITTALADSSSPVAMGAAMKKFACEDACFDVIIEDALHTEKAQLATLKNSFARLKPGGIYVAEDVQPEYKSKWNIHKKIITDIVGEHSSVVFVDNFRDAKSGKALHGSAVMIIKKTAAAK